MVDFNNLIRVKVVEPRQKRLFNVKALNVKQEIINKY